MRAALLGLALALIVSAPASAAPWDRYRVDDARATLKRVNALRASFGAPRLVEVPEWSTGCAKHVAYVRRNGVITHDEEPGAPGYTSDGATAGQTSVLTMPPSEPFVRGAPLGQWGDAPYHQAQVLDPRLRRTGFARGCMNTLAGLDEPWGAPRPGAPAGAAPPDGLARQRREGGAAGCERLQRAPEQPLRRCRLELRRRRHRALHLRARRRHGRVRLVGGGGGDPAGRHRDGDGADAPVAIVPSTSCGWIAVTGRPLPRKATVRMDVALGGATLSHRFSTVVPKKPKKRRGR